MTAEQVRHYRLPPIPIKETDNRQDNFMAKYGVAGATELDALEALHTGELKKIVKAAIRPYFDRTLSDRLWDAAQAANALVDKVWGSRRGSYVERLNQIKKKAEIIVEFHQAALDELKRQVEEETAALAESLQNQLELSGISKELDELDRDLQNENKTISLKLPDRPEPQFDLKHEADWLFGSRRDYLTQLAAYKARGTEVAP